MKTYFKYAVYSSIGAILWTLILYVIGFDRSDYYNSVSWISIFIPITFIYLGMKEIRDKEQNGFIEYGKAFNTGLMITLIHTAIFTCFSFFYFKFINPGIIDFQFQKRIEKMQEQGLDEGQMERASAMMQKWMSPVSFTITLFIGALLIGVFISLIEAAIVKKSDPNEIS